VFLKIDEFHSKIWGDVGVTNLSAKAAIELENQSNGSQASNNLVRPSTH
jgi:hypothetical protein